MARLYANENFPLPAVEAPRQKGHDVDHCAGWAGRHRGERRGGAPARHRRKNRAVLTLNRRHFIRLHLETPRHAGIIVCTFDPDFFALARRIDEALAASSGLEGQLLRVSRPG
jgi:hypothetical protein